MMTYSSIIGMAPVYWKPRIWKVGIQNVLQVLLEQTIYKLKATYKKQNDFL